MDRAAATRLALGTAQFGGRYGVMNRARALTPDTVQRVLERAAAYGIDTLDTAAAYGGAEVMLGVAGVSSWRIVTKLSALPDDCPDVEGWMERAVSESLARLRVDRIDGLLLHRPDQLLESRGSELYRAFARMKSTGLTRRIGISVYDPVQLSSLWPQFEFDVVQLPFNVLDTRFRDSGMIEELAAASVDVDLRSVFLQGLLLAPPAARPAFCDAFPAPLLRWDAWLDAHSTSAARAALAFALEQNLIHRVLIGITSFDELEELLAAASDPPLYVPEGLSCNEAGLIDPRVWPRT